MNPNTRRRRVSRILRLGVSNGEKSSSGELGELETELALLREENARLKVERHRPPDAGQVIERMRDLGREHPAPSGSPGDEEALRADPTGQAMVECLAIRDRMVEACQEVQQAMQGIRGRLGTLSIDLQDGVGDRARSSRIEVPDAEKTDIELAIGAGASSSLAQN